MKRLILFNFWFLCIFLNAQTPKIDSLLLAEKQAKYNNKIQIYNDLAKQYYSIDQKVSINYINKAIKLSKQLNDYSKLSTSYNIIATILYSRNEFEKANDYYEKCKYFAIKYNNESDLFKSQNNQLTLYLNGLSKLRPKIKILYIDHIKLALKRKEYDYLLKTIINMISMQFVYKDNAINSSEIIQTIEKVKEVEFKPYYYNILAYYYRVQNKPFNTIEVLKTVIKTTKDKNDYNRFVATMILAETYQYLMRYTESNFWYKEALTITQISDNSIVKLSVANLNSSIGNNCLSLKKYDKAWEYITLSEKYFTIENKLTDTYCINSINLSTIYLQKGKIDSSQYYLDRAFDQIKQLNFKQGEIMAYNLLVELRLQQKNFNALETIVPELELQLTTADQLYDTYESYKILRKYFIQTGKTEKILYYNDKMLALNDSIKGKEMSMLLNEFQVKYETEKKEQQILLQQSELKSKSRLLAISISAGVLVLIALILIAFLYNKRNQAYKRLVYQSINCPNESLILATVTSDDSEENANTLNENDNKPQQLTDEQKAQILVNLKQHIELKIYLQSDLNINKLAELCNTNRTYLSLFINETYRTNFNTYINKLRIDEAKRLLLERKNELQLKNLYTELGFNTYNVFNDAFKKHIGVTPAFFVRTINEN